MAASICCLPLYACLVEPINFSYGIAFCSVLLDGIFFEINEKQVFFEVHEQFSIVFN